MTPDSRDSQAPAGSAPAGLNEHETASLPFMIVGVGASAGGFEAFRELLEALPDRPGIAMIFVQHLDPEHESMLETLLARFTSMKVHQVQESVRVEPDHVYVAPPNANVVIMDGILSCQRIEAPAVRHRRSITSSARSPATRAARRSACSCPAAAPTARSGCRPSRPRAASPSPRTRSRPGTTACRAPRSLAGGVDYVLPPREIARELLRIERAHPHGCARGGRRAARDAGRRAGAATSSAASAVTQRRRLHPLQADHHPAPHPAADGAAQAVEPRATTCALLEEHPPRCTALYQDFLIRVTQLLPRPRGVRGAQGRRSSRGSWTASARRRAVCASGCPAAPPARRCTRWPSPARVPRRAAAATPVKILGHRPQRGRPRAGPRRRLHRQHRDRTSRRSGCGASSSASTAATRSARRSATCASSRGTTSPATRRSRTSTWSAAATCSSTWRRRCSGASCRSSTTRCNPRASCSSALGERRRASPTCSRGRRAAPPVRARRPAPACRHRLPAPAVRRSGAAPAARAGRRRAAERPGRAARGRPHRAGPLRPRRRGHRRDDEGRCSSAAAPAPTWSRPRAWPASTCCACCARGCWREVRAAIDQAQARERRRPAARRPALDEGGGVAAGHASR